MQTNLLCSERNSGVCLVIWAMKCCKMENPCFEPPGRHSQVASFLRFMQAKTSIACMVTFSSPRKVAHRMPCFSFISANIPNSSAWNFSISSLNIRFSVGFTLILMDKESSVKISLVRRSKGYFIEAKDSGISTKDEGIRRLTFSGMTSVSVNTNSS